MLPWFRVYHEALDDPKVQALPGNLFKIWFNMLCLAARNGGEIPEANLAFCLRLDEGKINGIVEDLLCRKLLDRDLAGTLRPHNWDGRQFLSDNSGGRVKKYRDRRREQGLPAMADYSKFRARLIARDGEQCVYCGDVVKLVVDHMVPISLGGTDDIDNLALACKSCNSGKAGRTPELAGMTVMVDSAALSLARYRDSRADVTVTVTPDVTPPDSEQNTEQNRAEEDSRGLSKKVSRETLIEAVQNWNNMADAKGLAKVQTLTEKRLRLLPLRLKELAGLVGWRDMLDKIAASPFLLGDNNNGWRIDFDFVMSPNNLAKVMEGKYDARPSGNSIQGALGALRARIGKGKKDSEH